MLKSVRFKVQFGLIGIFLLLASSTNAAPLRPSHVALTTQVIKQLKQAHVLKPGPQFIPRRAGFPPYQRPAPVYVYVIQNPQNPEEPSRQKNSQSFCKQVGWLVLGAGV